MAEVALVVGMAVTGQAVARHLRDRGARVVVVDDAPADSEAGARARQRADEAGFELVQMPDAAMVRSLVTEADVVVPSPGVPEFHPALALAAEMGRPVRSEIELAFRWSRQPLMAITGTNGKTTVTQLVSAMLAGSGLRPLVAGNIGFPLCDAVFRDVDMVVAEVSSFQLRFTDSFRPAVGVWLNLAEDHLDWHRDYGSYADAKARIWAHQGAGDVAVANADDPMVMSRAAAVSRDVAVRTFGGGLESPTGSAPGRGADYFVAGGMLRGPEGVLLPVADLPRALPHDLSNSLAAAAAALAAGATVEGVAEGLRTFDGLAHRLVLVADVGGVRWYDDSKATNPHATLAAVAGFASVVLLAGGRNKGLGLAPLAAGADRVRAVVALGEAAREVAAVFDGVRPVVTASSMAEAVRAAADLAQPGDAVLLSPACASFDWYGSYAERGDDFARSVQALLAEVEVGRGAH